MKHLQTFIRDQFVGLTVFSVSLVIFNWSYSAIFFHLILFKFKWLSKWKISIYTPLHFCLNNWATTFLSLSTVKFCSNCNATEHFHLAGIWKELLSRINWIYYWRFVVYHLKIAITWLNSKFDNSCLINFLNKSWA